MSKNGQKLKESYSFMATLPSRTPSIRFTGKGSILPSSNDMSLLFEAVNYQKARVRVRKIFANNLLQFFQQNYYDDQYYSSMDYVSRVVRDTTIDLGAKSSTRLDQGNTYSLDLSRLITDSRKSMYLLEIRGVDPLTPVDDEYDYDYYFGDYRTYKERSKVVVQSDIGLICKSSGSDQYVVYTTDLVSARPKGGCKVRIYDRQNQMLAEASTDSEGRAVLRTKDEPYIVTAEAGGDVTFVKVEPGTALSLSNFDVGGTANPKGIKGYIFGERGVWRPGDDIHLTFIVTSDNPLPESHPASLEFFNPNGQLVQSLVNNSSSDGIYTFSLGTTPASPTGLWRAKITFGGAQFEKSVRVDAIKPNRMKIELKLGDGQLVDAAHFTGSLTARWLHGTPAADAKAVLQAQLSQIATRFKGYEGYSFDDASKYFGTEEREIVTGTTDAQGSLALSTDELSSLEGLSPGMLSGRFTVKVFEKSGDFSVDQQVATISPYDTYFGIGVATQKSDWGDEYLDSRKEHIIKVVMLDSKGKPEPGSENVLVSVYKMDSYWWWDASTPNSQAHYAKNALNSNYKTLQATLSNGTGQATMRWSTGDYGYYMIRVTSPNRAHSATRIVCVSSSDWRGDVTSVTDAATRLALTRDKAKYVPGDKARVTIPSSPGARALVGIESGSVVRESFWVECTGKQTDIEIPVKEGMAPNIYVSVTLVQPHNSTLNDAPIRLFGVTRLDVEDAARRLTPVVEMPETVKPESEVTIKVREKNGRKMSYVLALVDEGLLGLTRFKTPDPYGYFNATEALGVRTWDMFDYVIGAYGGRIEQMFAIGGDAEQPNTGALKAQRFKPVVRFIDAQKTAAGAVHHAPRSFHRRRGRGSGHGLCPRRRGRESRRENRRERIVLARRAVQQEHHARPERRGGRIVPPEGQQANRHREGTGHGCVVGRQLRVGNRAGRPGTEPLCDPVEGLCHRPGQDNGGKTAQGERQGEAGTFVDPAHRPFSAPRIPGEISPRLHRADHLGRLPATLPAFGRGVRREHVAGHRPQRQERAFAPGQLPALRRRIRLLERQYVEIRMGDGLRDALPDRGCETRLRRGQGDARPGAQIPAQQPLGLLPDPGLYPVCAGAERDSDPGCHEPAPGKGRLAK